MLFLNRRGYAPLTLCRACGHRHALPELHRLAGGAPRAAPPAMPPLRPCRADPAPTARNAAREGSLAPVGPGVERVLEEAAAALPRGAPPGDGERHHPRPGRRRGGGAGDRRTREVDLIIGTQIVAKGWHFPHLTLVGVVDADLGLAGGDLRAAERTRAAAAPGRPAAPAARRRRARCCCRPSRPEHPVMQALVAGDLAAFMARGGGARRPGHWPPFGRLAALIVSSEDERGGRPRRARPGPGRAAGRGGGGAGPGAGAAGHAARPAPAAAAAEGAARRARCSRCCGSGWRGCEVPNSVRVQVDVDPVGFL